LVGRRIILFYRRAPLLLWGIASPPRANPPHYLGPCHSTLVQTLYLSVICV
jgi:hypothetical protein